MRRGTLPKGNESNKHAVTGDQLTIVINRKKISILIVYFLQDRYYIHKMNHIGDFPTPKTGKHYSTALVLAACRYCNFDNYT